MKKILTLVAIFTLSLQVAFAQSKPADLIKSIDAAKAATQDVKKAAKVATWTKLGDAYLKAYENPTANIPGMGVSAQELMLVMGNDKPKSTESITLDGKTYEKQVFKDKNLYFLGGRLAFVEVTKPVLGKEDALEGVIGAYTKAAELDVKGAKKKDISKIFSMVDQNYFTDAYTAFVLGNKQKAAELFLKAGEVSVSPLSPKVDTSAFFNAGLAAAGTGNLDMAGECYEKALAQGYAQTSQGDIYASLADVKLEQKDTVAARKYLEEGFAAYPNNAKIMTNLINLYLWTKGDPRQIIDLLNKAKEQMPDNSGLYDVEGDIWKNLGEYDNAVAAYHKSLEINPQGDYPYYAEAQLYIDKYNKLDAEKSMVDLRDTKKYDELDKLAKETLQKSIEPLEKCFAVTTRDNMKLAAADYLKKVYFQLRSVNPEYSAKHKEYDEICKQLQSK